MYLCLRYRNINTVFEGKKESNLFVCFARILTNASFYAPAASFEDLGGYLGKWEDTKCGCPRGMLSSVCHVCTCTVWPSPSHISLQTQLTYSAVSAHTDRLGGHRFMGYFGLLSLNFKVFVRSINCSDESTAPSSSEQQCQVQSRRGWSCNLSHFLDFINNIMYSIIISKSLLLHSVYVLTTLHIVWLLHTHFLFLITFLVSFNNICDHNSLEFVLL